MKCLSLKQPYAWALFHGKDIENRTWSTNHRGLLLVHASKGGTRSYYEEAYTVCKQRGLEVPSLSELTRGAIIGVVDVTGCRWGESSRGWGFAQQWHWSISNARLFKEAIPCQGTLGLFDVDLSIREIQRLIKEVTQ